MEEKEFARNLLLFIKFKGSMYHGFQVQKNAISVAEVLQDSMQKVMGNRDDIKGCSRTDSGVHANEFCVSVKTNCRIPCANLIEALNICLPNDVAVKACKEVPLDFHARYNCVGKRYIYKIYNSRIKDPFLYMLAYQCRHNLDVNILNEECKSFIGTHDFSALCAANTKITDKVRTIQNCGMIRQGECVEFYVEGNGFLYNMVRIMVGTMLEIASGRIQSGKIPEIISSLDRSKAGFTAPAYGLYLDKVFYEVKK